MNADQCRAARGLLNWTQDRLAETATVSVNTVRNFERGATTPTANNLAAIKRALEGAGIDFIEPSRYGGLYFYGGVQLRLPDGGTELPKGEQLSEDDI